jgi:hypothetical protein
MMPDADCNKVNLLLQKGNHRYMNLETLPQKYILTNVQECATTLSLMVVADAWQGTGHLELEYLLAIAFVEKILKAYKEGSNEADITELFSYDFSDQSGRVFTKKDIVKHVLRSFRINEDEPKKICLEWNIRA